MNRTELIERVKCKPGTMSTALDVCIDDIRERACGMCGCNTVRLHDVCPDCGHRLDYFQINTQASGLGDWRDFAKFMLERCGHKLPTAETEVNFYLAIKVLQQVRKAEDANQLSDDLFNGPDGAMIP